MAKRKGSSKYRSLRNGASHCADNCPICAGRECRVKVSNPDFGEFDAILSARDLCGRTEVEPSAVVAKVSRDVGGSGFGAPRPFGFEPAAWDPRGLREVQNAFIPCATELAIRSLQVWGAQHARL